jgi:hypothetical protein
VERKGCGGRKALNAIVLPGALALVLAAMTATGAQAQPNVEGLLVRVGERVAEFYKLAKNVICIETSTVQPVDFMTDFPGQVTRDKRRRICQRRRQRLRQLAMFAASSADRLPDRAITRGSGPRGCTSRQDRATRKECSRLLEFAMHTRAAASSYLRAVLPGRPA